MQSWCNECKPSGTIYTCNKEDLRMTKVMKIIVPYGSNAILKIIFNKYNLFFHILI